MDLDALADLARLNWTFHKWRNKWLRFIAFMFSQLAFL